AVRALSSSLFRVLAGDGHRRPRPRITRSSLARRSASRNPVEIPRDDGLQGCPVCVSTPIQQLLKRGCDRLLVVVAHEHVPTTVFDSRAVLKLAIELARA